MPIMRVVSLKEVLLLLTVLGAGVYFVTKKKVKKDMQADIDAAYRRGYNECLENLKKKTA